MTLWSIHTYVCKSGLVDGKEANLLAVVTFKVVHGQLLDITIHVVNDEWFSNTACELCVPGL